MCQATVYLNGEEIMKDVLLVEPRPEGILLATLFEPPRVVPAVIRSIDLMKHRVFLATPQEQEEGDERTGQTAGAAATLD